MAGLSCAEIVKAKMFRAIAERIEAGEPYPDVLRDYDVSVGALADAERPGA